MKNFLKEFKDFAMKGNVIDLAVGVMIGAAFGKIVSSLVDDIIMPLLSVLLGNVNFTNLKVLLVENGEKSIYLNYGAFIQNVFNFLIIALCIFTIISMLNKLKKEKQEEVAPVEAPTISDETKALQEIIEILKNK